MDIYCTEEFYKSFETLRGQKAYRGLENEISEYFLGKPIEEILSGKRLNNSTTHPIIKKRLNGSGGYRIYYLIKISDSFVLLLFVHPKTGPEGGENITDEHYTFISKQAFEAMSKNSYLIMTFDPLTNKLIFRKIGEQSNKLL